MRPTWIHILAWILTTFGRCNTIVNPAMILQRNRMEVMERNDEVEGFNPMISCLEIVAREWFTNKEGVPLLVPNFLDNPELSRAFFTGLQNEVATFSVAEDFSNFGGYQTTRSAVILVRNSTDFDLMNDLNELCAPRCRYVVCLLTFYEDEESLLEEADAVVKAMWRTWIINLVIVASAGGKFLVAGGYSFESNSHRVPGRPEILGECSTLATKPNKYIFHKLLMNNCRINITVSDCPPYVQLVEKDGQEVLVGTEGSLFETVAKSLDISLNRLSIDLSTDANVSVYETLLGILDDHDESDVVFCGLYWDIENGIEYSVTFDRQEIVWLVPSLPALSLLGLITPLHNFVWFAIIGLLVFTAIMKVLLFRKLSFLTVLGLILGVALPQQPKSLSNRIQFISWVFFGYVITQGYLASLAGQLMNTNYQTIKTMEELENSGISFGGSVRHRDLFKDDENPVSHRIYQKYQILTAEEYEVVMAAMLAGKNNSMALVDEIEISNGKPRPGPYDPHSLAETLANYPVSLAAWKGLPYLDQINDKVIQLKEAGLISYWSEKYDNTSHSMIDVNLSNELDMLHLSPSFLLLLLGHALSIIVFFAEIGIYAKTKHVRFTRSNKVNKISK